MKLRSLITSFLALAGLALVHCSSLADQCSKAAPTPGVTCDNEGLQCPYSIDQPNCDGTSTTIATSCFCTEAAWSCPAPVDPVDCPPATDDGGGGDDAAAE